MHFLYWAGTAGYSGVDVLMKIKIEKGKPIMFFVIVRGPNGSREYRAVLDTGSQYCVLPLQDARDLGYDAYAHPDDPGEGVWAVTKTDMTEYNEVELESVEIAGLKAREVKALAYYLPKQSHLEATLGLSFLEHFKTTIDYDSGYMTIEDV
jgi:predicted aspartyl protease